MTPSAPKRISGAIITPAPALSYLDRFEGEAIHILREAAAEAERPVMLYSIGKDSAVLAPCDKSVLPRPLPAVAHRHNMEVSRHVRAAAIQANEVLKSYLNPRGFWRDRRGANGAFADEPAPARSFYHVMLAYAELICVAGAL